MSFRSTFTPSKGQSLQHFLRLAGGKGNILHGSCLSFEGDHDSGVFKKVERGTVSFIDQHKVNPCSSILHHHRDFINGAALDVIEWDRPCEDAKRKFYGFRCDADGERSVIDRVEKEEAGKHKKNHGKGIPFADVYAPNKKQKE